MKTRVLMFFIIALFMVTILNSEEVRGCTHKELPPEKITVIGKAEVYYPELTEKVKTVSFPSPDREDWELINLINLDSFIRPGKHLGVTFNSSEQTIEVISNYEELIPESIEAIEKSPAWMRADLENVFCQLSDTDQATWAGVINDAFDPFIDEIAFSIAHSSVAFLSSIYSNPDLFTENAILIYLTDNDLEYVEIVDYGSSTTDENNL